MEGKTLCHYVGHGCPRRGVRSKETSVLEGHHSVAMVSHGVAAGVAQAHKVLGFPPYLSP